MSERIEIPAANLRNIAIFPEEPDDSIIDEIKSHVRLTARPYEWRGHSHTKPAHGAFVVYIEEFDVPAPDKIKAVAPCPCCNPHHAQYKNKGKIAWFPDEKVVRLIGPRCFANINAGGHDAALIDLRKRQKRRAELATISLHAPQLESLIGVLDKAMPIAEDLDDFMREINRVLDNELQLQVWREVKGGILATTQVRHVSFQRADGTSGERMEDFSVPFGRIEGHSMIDRSGQVAATKIGPLRVGLASILKRLVEAGAPDQLSDTLRAQIADLLPKGRLALAEILAGLRDRQKLLTTDAIMTLSRWAQHPDAPIRFSIERKKGEIRISAPGRGWTTPPIHTVAIGESAIERVPELPSLQLDGAVNSRRAEQGK